jgi:hypothetical protein
VAYEKGETYLDTDCILEGAQIQIHFFAKELLIVG